MARMSSPPLLLPTGCQEALEAAGRIAPGPHFLSIHKHKPALPRPLAPGQMRRFGNQEGTERLAFVAEHRAVDPKLSILPVLRPLPDKQGQDIGAEQHQALPRANELPLFLLLFTAGPCMATFSRTVFSSTIILSGAVVPAVQGIAGRIAVAGQAPMRRQKRIATLNRREKPKLRRGAEVKGRKAKVRVVAHALYS